MLDNKLSIVWYLEALHFGGAIDISHVKHGFLYVLDQVCILYKDASKLMTSIP